jgi:hypothetical protein
MKKSWKIVHTLIGAWGPILSFILFTNNLIDCNIIVNLSKEKSRCQESFQL